MIRYEVVDWDELYETHQTRGLPIMLWHRTYIKLDGRGYVRMLQQKSGEAMFGAWGAFLQLAARCTPRGTVAMNVADIAAITRFKPDTIQRMLTFAAEMEWVVSNGEDDSLREHASKLLSTTAERNGTERNGTQQTLVGVCSEDLSDRLLDDRWRDLFLTRLWPKYPRKVGKKKALIIWMRLRPVKVRTAEGLDQMYERWRIVINHRATTDKWRDRPSEKIPHLSSVLNQEEP